MNGGRRWRPFTIDLAEYQALVDDLVRLHGFAFVEVPAWVGSREEWRVWLLERRRGVPAEPHRRLREQARDAVRWFEQAQQEQGTPPTRLAELFLAAKRAQDDADHFGDPWLRTPN
jgi:hypothetical protein